MRKELLLRVIGQDLLEFVSQHLDLFDDDATAVLMTSTQFNIEAIENEDGNLRNIVNLKRINDIRFINKVFETINHKLPVGGQFIGCAETRSLRKKRILVKYNKFFGYIYYTMDFVFKRLFPKLPILKKIYFFITAGRNRHLSKAETLGRLYSCGFKVNAIFYSGNLLFFAAEKVKEPDYNLNPSYGMIFKMRRIGKGGKIINVFKFRTMHPFSEYLQDYIYEHHELKEGGKFNNDFRIHTLGTFMRKVWLDELPMIINLFKGDLKLVGVRPLSRQYLSLYTEELREMRKQTKPGLVPPYYADLPRTLDEIMDSELRYLKAHRKNPVGTDIRYFFLAFKNIFFRKARSG